MRRLSSPPQLLLSLLLAGLLTSAAFASSPATQESPWRAVGLTDLEAAAHLLDRFAYGARPGEAERVAEEGLYEWLEAQIDGVSEPSELERELAGDEVLSMTATQIAEAFPPPALTLRRLQAGEFRTFP